MASGTNLFTNYTLWWLRNLAPEILKQSGRADGECGKRGQQQHLQGIECPSPTDDYCPRCGRTDLPVGPKNTARLGRAVAAQLTAWMTLGFSSILELTASHPARQSCALRITYFLTERKTGQQKTSCSELLNLILEACGVGQTSKHFQNSGCIW